MTRTFQFEGFRIRFSSHSSKEYISAQTTPNLQERYVMEDPIETFSCCNSASRSTET